MSITIEALRRKALKIAAAVAITVTITWPAVVPADAGHPARALVEETTSNVLEVLKSQRDTLRSDPRRLHEFVDEFILPYIDFERMSRRVVGKRWRKVSPEQRTRFVSEFRLLLVRTYAAALNEYRDQVIISYLDPVKGKKENEVIIPMLIEATGREVSVAYAMYHGEEGWKIIDISIDGVSLAKNYRSSFRAEIARHGINGLIERLAAKNMEISGQ